MADQSTGSIAPPGPDFGELPDVVSRATTNDDDVTRLPPIGTNHSNVLRRYHFSLTDAVARGERIDPASRRDCAVKVS
jgi:hypothetical protein